MKKRSVLCLALILAGYFLLLASILWDTAPDPRPAMLRGAGVFLLTFGIVDTIRMKSEPDYQKRKKIEYRDERNIAIWNRAGVVCGKKPFGAAVGIAVSKRYVKETAGRLKSRPAVLSGVRVSHGAVALQFVIDLQLRAAGAGDDRLGLLLAVLGLSLELRHRPGVIPGMGMCPVRTGHSFFRHNITSAVACPAPGLFIR